MSIFDLTTEHQQIMLELAHWFEENPDEEGVIPDWADERLHINQNEIEEKVNTYLEIVNDVNYQIMAIENEIARLKARKIAKKRLEERIKYYLELAVKEYGTIKGKAKSRSIETLLNKVSWVYRPKVQVNNIELIPDDFKTNIITFALSVEDANRLTQLADENNIFLDSIEYKVQKDKLQRALESLPVDEETGEFIPIPGCELDTENGYIKRS